MTTYSYLRVSTIDQNTEKNKLEVLRFANEKKLGKVDFVEEQISGKSNFKNRQLLDVMFESITVENRKVKYTYKKPFCYFAKCDLDNVDGVIDYIKNNINI